jgi:RNA polymerase sigma-70 factor (ECF subfamily)
MNQGFFKIFKYIHKYNEERPFKAWFGKIMTNVSIDFYRSNLKLACCEELKKAEHVADGDWVDRNLNYDDLLAMVQRLPQGYRTVFNLYAIDGYSHGKIGEMLNINIGTSKSNLFKARRKLKQMIMMADEPAGNFNRGSDHSSIIAINGAAFEIRFFGNGIR